MGGAPFALGRIDCEARVTPSSEVNGQMASETRVLQGPSARSGQKWIAPQPDSAWRFIGWFGLVLLAAGIGDWLLSWFPMRFGTPEWEFGTIAATYAGLPLITMGWAGLLGSAVARGARRQVLLVAWLSLVWVLVLVAGLVIFALDVPLALRVVPDGPARTGIVKAIIKTTFLGGLFAAAYAVAGVGALLHCRSSEPR